MFKLNLKIALRNLWKNKTSSFINVIGLAIGLAACLMLLLYVSYEWNFDKQAKKSKDVYIVMTHITDDFGKDIFTFDGTPTSLSSTISSGIPEIEFVSRVSYDQNLLIANGENSFKKTAKFADADFIKMYDFEFLSGDEKTALLKPGSVILTQSMAQTLFGTTQVIDRTVRFQDKTDLKITGVVKDAPSNSSNKFDYLLPWSEYGKVDKAADDLSWGNYSFNTLVRLTENANILDVDNKMDRLVKGKAKWNHSPFFLFPLSKLHLFGKFENGKSVGGDIDQIWLFMGLAFGILLIACINFMNMATAKSEKRAKEVGIKKTIGATRKSLILQFLTESMVLTLLSIFIAIILVEGALPTFGNLLNISLNISFVEIKSWLAILGIVFFTGLIAGSYPAFYLSSFNPIQTLKRKIKSRGFLSINLRQVLIIGQFCFAIMLIISTIVIYKQIQFIKDKPVGIDVNALVDMPLEGELKEKFDLLKTNLLNSGAVSSVAQSSISLLHHGRNFSGLEWQGMSKAQNSILFNQVGTAYDFIKTSGLKLISGRDFSPQYSSDTVSVLISSAAAKIMELKNPIGSVLKFNKTDVTVIGVFEDYAWDSPYNANNPMIVYFNKDNSENVTMRLNPKQSLQENVSVIEKITKEINPAYPVQLNFVSSSYDKLLRKEKTLGILSNLFGGLAIFVSCLGLFGLVAYSAEQRTKEFGVRKVLGASVASLMQLLSLSFIKMIGVAIVIAIPISYYAMGKWLNNFEFHTEITWWIMPLAAISTLLMALITVSFQAYKTAKANPVDALKYE
ncbi:ABC transporter permease [Pedobacter mendelii]|uniref:ABC transporter permease n=1 Tax=Pedobacter mendelii TaxID=1908240 RepID=A0ABQ2BFX9_9SPHI|nr:ABC transporter permease [Pedobacter mendelii]GGI23535.1 ABC transporter permease [Pedobacter mendelii]